MARKKIEKPNYTITSLQGIAGIFVAQGIFFLNADAPWKVYTGIGCLLLAGGIFFVRDNLKFKK